LGLEKKYFLVVLGSFDKGTIEYEDYPTKEEIKSAIKQLQGSSARVEKRYVLKSEERVGV